MSGHSKWSTIKREKGVKDAKRGAIFTRIGNMIAIAARGGADPTMNSTLAMAIEKAKQVNMPAVNIQRAIDRAKDKNAAVLEEITYEAIGPGGVGLIIETATDNKNRTFPELRNVITKSGGRIADAGSVMFQFTREGVIRIKQTDEDSLLKVIDAGVIDADVVDDELIAFTDQKDLAKVRADVIEAGLDIISAELQYIPKNQIEIDDKDLSQKVENLIEAIEDLDDIMNVYSNANLLTEK